MADEHSEAHANPDYGNGVYRRRIRLAARQGEVTGELEDCNHGFRVRIEHDDSHVTSVTGEALRVPMTTCPGAVEPLRALEGHALDAGVSHFLRAVNPRDNCTHLYDLSLLAIAQAARGEGVRQYDVLVHDQQGDEPLAAEVFRDGERVHRWLVNDNRITSPEALAGNTVMQGFTFWANRRFDGDDNEAAFVLQKGFFVSGARRWDMSRVGGLPATDHPYMLGACYSYSSPQVEQATRLGDSVRDFTDCEEQLLQFR